MRNQAARSGRAHALREFADRVLARAAVEADPSAAAQMLEWQAAILVEAERVDPFNAPADLRSVEPEEITASDLAPLHAVGHEHLLPSGSASLSAPGFGTT